MWRQGSGWLGEEELGGGWQGEGEGEREVEQMVDLYIGMHNNNHRYTHTHACMPEYEEYEYSVGDMHCPQVWYFLLNLRLHLFHARMV